MSYVTWEVCWAFNGGNGLDYRRRALASFLTVIKIASNYSKIKLPSSFLKNCQPFFFKTSSDSNHIHHFIHHILSHCSVLNNNTNERRIFSHINVMRQLDNMSNTKNLFMIQKRTFWKCYETRKCFIECIHQVGIEGWIIFIL